MGLGMSSQPQLKQQGKIEAILEDRRKYECTIHPWNEFKDGYQQFHFLDGYPKYPPRGETHFNIKALLKESYCHLPNMQEIHTNTARYDFFNIPINSIKQAINYILSILNVPEANLAPMAQQILDYAENMANNTYRMNTNHFMIVMLDADIFYQDNNNYDGTTSLKDQACQAKPTTDSKLKGVKIELKETCAIFKDFCAICRDDLREDAVQMPCSHFYHGNCIIQWLLKKNYCVRCYFKMPPSSDLCNISAPCSRPIVQPQQPHQKVVQRRKAVQPRQEAVYFLLYFLFRYRCSRFKIHRRREAIYFTLYFLFRFFRWNSRSNG